MISGIDEELLDYRINWNRDPALSNADVAPDNGESDQSFTYTVKYTDQDGHMPSEHKVYIDGTGYDMTQFVGSDPTVGIFYNFLIYGSDLGAGLHNYYFYFEDGHGGSDRDPDSETYSGPNVDAVPDIRIEPLTLNFPTTENIPIFVEIDWMEEEDGTHSHRPSQNVINRIVQTFADEGFTINIDVSNAIPHQDVVDITDNPSSSPDIQAIRDEHFDHISDSRYYYSIWAHNFSRYGGAATNRSGIADLPGRIHLVTLRYDGSENHQVGTFIHELGHNLNQRHGGEDDELYKPNYISVMNYFYQLDGIGPTLLSLGLANSSDGFNDFGYSHGTLDDLDEDHLDEAVGIGLGRAVDWNCDDDFIDTDVAQDIQVEDGNWCSGSENRSVLSDFDNWSDIRNNIQSGDLSLLREPESRMDNMAKSAPPIFGFSAN